MTDTLTKSSPATSSTSTPDPRRWLILAILGVAQLMVVLDATIVNIALPSAQHSLGFSDNARQWIVTAYALSFGSLLLIGGRIADIVGRKWVFVVGMIGFAIASAVGGASADVGMLIAARAVQGAFAALLAPAILSLLTTTFTEPSERGKAFGVFGAIAGAGASVGLLLGGLLTEYANWRWTLFVNLLFAAIGIVGGLLLLTHSKVTDRAKLDLTGTVVVSAGLFALVYGFSSAESNGWGSAVTISMLVAAGVLLTAFVVLQQRVANPLLPLRILTDRNRAGSLIAMFLAALGMFAVFLFLTYFLQQQLHYSAVKSGVAFLPLTGVLVVVSSLASTVLMTRVSPRIMIPLGMLISAVGLWLLTNISLDSSYAADVLPAVMLLGGGLGLVFAPAFSLATLGVQAHDSGVASATVNVMQQVGGAVGTALLNTIAVSALNTYVAGHVATQGKALALNNGALHSYVVSFWVAAIVFAAGAVLVGLVLKPGVPDLSGENGAPAVL